MRGHEIFLRPFKSYEFLMILLFNETNEVLVTIKSEAYLVKSLPGGRGLQLSLASKPY